MQEQYTALHQAFTDELFRTLQSASPEADKMNGCCRSSVRYWEELKLMVERLGFRSDDEEIRFFKQEKPRFTGMIEYWLLRYQAILFLPERKEDWVDFWRGELRKVDRFRVENGEFWGYYHSDDTAQDRTWFRRISGVANMRDKDRIYNQDPLTSCPKDWTVAMVVACGLYRAYIQETMVHYF